MMSLQSKKRLLGLAAVAALGFIGSTALATNYPGSSGVPWIPGEAGCFTRGWTALWNTCTSGNMKLVMYPLSFTTTTDWKYVWVNTYSPTPGGLGQGLECSAYAVTTTGGQVSFTGWRPMTVTGGNYQSLNVGSVYVGGGNSHQAECRFGNGAAGSPNGSKVMSVVSNDVPVYP